MLPRRVHQFGAFAPVHRKKKIALIRLSCCPRGCAHAAKRRIPNTDDVDVGQMDVHLGVRGLG